MELKYTDEKAVLLLIALLKENGIKRVIVSPGVTNYAFVGSIQHDDFFQLYSCVDERSAAYMACGMAAETDEPVVITCTGATSERNYLPGLTEAYYRKLPVLAVCGHRGVSAIGHLHDQQLDRRNEPVDVANVQVWLPFVKDQEDEQLCYNEINKAILALSKHGGGPAMINLCTHYSPNMSVQNLPNVQRVAYYTCSDKLPVLPEGRIAIVLGSHRLFTPEETEIIDAFCASYDAVVICDHTSGYYGKYAVHSSLIFIQDKKSELAAARLCLYSGEISGDSCGVLSMWSEETWRIGEDGEFRNRTGKVTKVFEMSLPQFCQNYRQDGETQNIYLNQCREEYSNIYSKIPELPFSNVWIAKHLAPRIPPNNSSICFGINNSLRSWNLFDIPQGVRGMANVGGYGIDGTISSAVGRAIANPDKIVYCVLGDLAFFYDMNVLGNRYIGKNLRILLINNGLGDEFRMSKSPSYKALGEDVRPYVAAEGHYGHIETTIVRAYVESIGYRYLTASSKEEFLKLVDEFVSPEINQSIVLEVKIKAEDDTEAVDLISHIVMRDNHESLKKRLKKKIKSIVREEKISAIQTLLK